MAYVLNYLWSFVICDFRYYRMRPGWSPFPAVPDAPLSRRLEMPRHESDRSVVDEIKLEEVVDVVNRSVICSLWSGVS